MGDDVLGLLEMRIGWAKVLNNQISNQILSHLPRNVLIVEYHLSIRRLLKDDEEGVEGEQHGESYDTAEVCLEVVNAPNEKVWRWTC